jgi:effector-binding domain-containing protein
MLDKVWSFLATAPADLHQHGHNIMLYKDSVPNVEVGVLVTRHFDSAGDVVPSFLPGGHVAVATHTGPVQEIGSTHDAVRHWCVENGHMLAGPRWEVYGDPDSDNHFDVEISWLLGTTASPSTTA